MKYNSHSFISATNILSGVVVINTISLVCKQVNVHFLAWKQGLKTLYYCRSEKLGKADRVSKRIEREVIKELDFQEMIDGDTCVACEG